MIHFLLRWSLFRRHSSIFRGELSWDTEDNNMPRNRQTLAELIQGQLLAGKVPWVTVNQLMVDTKHSGMIMCTYIYIFTHKSTCSMIPCVNCMYCDIIFFVFLFFCMLHYSKIVYSHAYIHITILFFVFFGLRIKNCDSYRRNIVTNGPHISQIHRWEDHGWFTWISGRANKSAAWIPIGMAYGEKN